MPNYARDKNAWHEGFRQGVGLESRHHPAQFNPRAAPPGGGHRRMTRWSNTRVGDQRVDPAARSSARAALRMFASP